MESLGALEGLLVSPSPALAASGAASAGGIWMPRGAGDSWTGRGQAHSHLQSLAEAQNRRAALEELWSVRSAKQNKQYWRLKGSEGVGITTPNLCICFCCSQIMAGSSQRWEVTEITGPADEMLCLEHSPSTGDLLPFPSACASPDKAARQSNDN